MASPKVSIITALCNKGAYIAETVKSVLEQTVTQWEMLVVDNGSNDEGPQIVEAFRDSRIRLMQSSKQGPGAARNCGIAESKGEWVLFLDADDLLHCNYLEEQLETARQYPEAGIIVGCWQEFYDSSPSQCELRCPAGYRTHGAGVVNSAIGFAPWALHAAIIRRSWLGKERWWHEALDSWPSEDSAFWFSAILGARIAWSNSHGALYRICTPNSRNSLADSSRWLEALVQVVDTNVATLQRFSLTPSPRQRETIMRVFESHYQRAIQRGQTAVAHEALRHANYWLRQCRSNSVSVILRKFLGLRLSSEIIKRIAPRNGKFGHATESIS